MKQYREWTPVEYQEIIAFRSGEDKKSWGELAQIYNTSNENVRAAYRRAVGAKHSGYMNRDDQDTNSFEQSETYIHVVCSSKRMTTQEDIIKKFNIDTSIWEVESFKVKTSEGYRKDRKVDWEVEDGKVLHGKVKDTGKLLIAPMFHVEVKFLKKKSEAQAKLAIEQMILDAKQFMPIYPKVEYAPTSGKLMYEIDMFDIHFGRLTWSEESGENYDVKLAKQAIQTTLTKLLDRVKGQDIAKIVLPMGNDFFNVDSKFNTTTGGTPQQEDTRWQKTFRLGREMSVWMIDACSQIAPVDVIMLGGNHDEQRTFYLGEVLESWYHNSDNVNINNLARKRKYYAWGTNLIGFAHGADEKLEKLPLVMAVEEPHQWAKSTYREWHTGDKHHLKKLVPYADESTGMVIRILRSLASYDAWTFNQGYSSLRSSEAFLWDADEGLISQHTATPNLK